MPVHTKSTLLAFAPVYGNNPTSTYPVPKPNIMADPDGSFAAGIQVKVLWYWVKVKVMLLYGYSRLTYNFGIIKLAQIAALTSKRLMHDLSSKVLWGARCSQTLTDPCSRCPVLFAPLSHPLYRLFGLCGRLLARNRLQLQEMLH